MTVQSTDSPSAVRGRLIPEDERSQVLPRHFGKHMMRFEGAVYRFAEELCTQYRGGLWNFYEIEGGGFYMAPEGPAVQVRVDSNGFEGEMSADAFGITVCLFALSHLSFHVEAETLATHFHLLREWAMEHPEVRPIFSAID